MLDISLLKFCYIKKPIVNIPSLSKFRTVNTLYYFNGNRPNKLLFSSVGINHEMIDKNMFNI